MLLWGGPQPEEVYLGYPFTTWPRGLGLRSVSLAGTVGAKHIGIEHIGINQRWIRHNDHDQHVGINEWRLQHDDGPAGFAAHS